MTVAYNCLLQLFIYPFMIVQKKHSSLFFKYILHQIKHSGEILWIGEILMGHKPVYQFMQGFPDGPTPFR